MTNWQPTSFEDKLIYNYWKAYQGIVVLEVPIGSSKGPGKWPKKSKVRRIDGIRLVQDNGNHGIFPWANYSLDAFAEKVREAPIELIEAKDKLNRLVIGQIIAGLDMFERQYGTKKITPVILCSEGDPALEWVCKKREILVFIQVTSGDIVRLV